VPEYIQVAVNVPRVQGVFDYHLPPELEGRLRPGHLVLAPFGPRLVQGVVLGTVAQPQVPETKAIDMLLDEQPVLTEQQLVLARHLSESCLAPLAACVSLMLPSGIGKLADVEYALTDEGEAFDGELSAAQARLHALLKERGALRGGQINHALPRKNWRSSAAALVNKGLVKTTALPPMPSARAKTVRTAEFVAAPPDEKMLSKQAAPRARRAKMLEVLQREPGPMDADWLYAESQGSLADLHVLEGLGLVRLSARESLRDPLAELAYDPSLAPQLTADQARVWDEVQKALANAHLNEAPKPILLHGVTGSGKTEI
jgi:primosomal protein N' (replication factor Y)